MSWLLALAVLGLLVAATRVPWRRLDERGRSLLLWGAWLLTAGAFFSVAEFFHPYYTVMLAPSIAALAAIGVAVLWREYRAASWRGWLLPLALLAAAAVQAYILRDYPDWSRWLTPLVVGATLVAALALAALRLRHVTRVALPAAGLAVAALLAAPTTWAAYSVANGANSTIPTAGPSARTGDGFGGAGAFGNRRGFGAFGAPNGASSGSKGSTSDSSGNAGAPGGFGAPPSGGAPSSGGFGSGAGAAGNGTPPFGAANGSRFAGRGGPGDQVDTALVRYLEAHQGNAKYLVATASSMSASSIIITTGKAVMALGGFSGSDKILTTQQLARLVANGTVHYFLVQSGGPGGGAPSASTLSQLPASMRARIAERGGFGGNGGPGGNSALTQWVTTHGAIVPSSQYETSSASAGGFGQATLYYVSSAAAAK